MYTSGILTLIMMVFWARSLSPGTSILVGSLLLIPSGIDGTTQLFGERESTNSLRIFTGLLLGVGVVLMAYGVSYLVLTTLF